MSISPDLTVVGVELPDVDPLEIAEAALDAVTDVLPAFDPRDGSPEVRVIEAAAQTAADVRGDLRQVPGWVILGILGILGVERDGGTPATGTVAVTLDAARTMTVPAGSQLGDPATGIIVETTTDITIDAATSLTLPVAAIDAGSSANTVGAGTNLDVYDSIPGSVTATLTTALSGGTDPEVDEQYFARGAAVFGRLTSSLVLPTHYVAFAMADPRVGRATAIDLFKPGGTVGADLGHVTVPVRGKGASLSTEVRAEIQAAMQAISAAMITVHVADVAVVTQAFALTVHALPGYSTPGLQASVAAALQAFYDPARYPFGRDVLPTEVAAIAADVEGVDYVTTVATPASPVAIADAALVQAGTITVTVTT